MEGTAHRLLPEGADRHLDDILARTRRNLVGG